MAGNRGISMLEVIVASSILSLGIMATMVLQTSSVQINSKANSVTEASAFASDEMEYRMALNYNSAYLQENATYVIDSDCCPEHPAVGRGYTINTTIGAASYFQKPVTVTVNWKGLGSNSRDGRQVVLQSIKTRLRDR